MIPKYLKLLYDEKRYVFMNSKTKTGNDTMQKKLKEKERRKTDFQKEREEKYQSEDI